MSFICDGKNAENFIFVDFLGNNQLAGISLDDWLILGGTLEMLYGYSPQAQYNPADYLYHDEMGNAQLAGISYYEYVAIGGHPDDLAPRFDAPQAEQEVIQDVLFFSV